MPSLSRWQWLPLGLLAAAFVVGPAFHSTWSDVLSIALLVTALVAALALRGLSQR